jgi:hypothetical protein
VLHGESKLSDSAQHRLSIYALAASGTEALCFAKPAEARIVYTPAYVAIKPNGGWFQFDLNHDGTPDFGLSNKWSYNGGTLKVLQSQVADEIWMTNSKACGTLSVAAALPKGKRIGPKNL